jgi:hypothetical protein
VPPIAVDHHERLDWCPGPPTIPRNYPTCYPTFMHKTSVYLSPEDLVRLSTLAEREGTSQAEVIRRAIRMYLPVRQGDRDFSLFAVVDGPGGSVADVNEEDLMEGFGT